MLCLIFKHPVYFQMTSVKISNFKAESGEESNDDVGQGHIGTEMLNQVERNKNVATEEIPNVEEPRQIHNAKRLNGDTREERENKSNAGDDYITKSNKLVPARKMKELKSCRN